ncbi:MAG TPA: tail fiber domain-containing protein [Parcubacteria group bacterium]|nr:tail fiber domain-containing protein [Parcubacteria group bacterium]
MKRLFLVVGLIALSLGVGQAYAWVEPTLAPPNGNVTAPLRLDANGRLGIGITSPGKLFEVMSEIVTRASSASGGVASSFSSDSTGAQIWVNSAYDPASPSTGWGRRVTIAPNGNVGINNQFPSARLHVNLDANREIRVGTGISTALTDASVFGPVLSFSRGSDGADDIAGIFQYTTSGAANRLAIASRDDIVFAAGGGSTYPSAPERMRINSAGNVGIGTSAPNEPLEVANSTNGGRLIVSDGAGASRRTLLLVSPTATNNFGRVESYNYGASTGVPLYINSSGGGNVSVGNLAPTYKLTVAGDVNVPTGSCYRVNGVCITSGGVSGSGTVNTLSMFTAASTLGDSRLSQQADGSVRTTSPTGWVDIGPKNAGFNHIYTDRPATIFNTGVWTISGIFSAYNLDNLRLQTNGIDRITALASNGNVGIGTAAPTQRLTVNGNLNKLGSWIIGDANWSPQGLEVHNSSWDGVSNNNYGAVAGGKLFAYNGLQSGGATGAEATDGQLYVAGTSMLMGNVGIGKNNPSNTLDVAGGMNVELNADAIYAGYVRNTHINGNGLSGEGGIYGVRGLANNGSGSGVYGQGAAGAAARGVVGAANDGYGVYGISTFGYGIYCAAAGTGFCGGTRAWTNTSDIRLKKNVSTITSGLDKVLRLRGVNYTWKNDETNKKNIGFIAQEVMEVLPEVVNKNNEGYYTVNESSVNAVLVEAVKELKAENDDLKARLERLEAKLK